MQPESSNEPEPITIVELIAYLVIGLSLVFAINMALDWAGRQLGTNIMEVGRRRDLGFVLSLILGLLLTRKVAAWAGFTPRKKG